MCTNKHPPKKHCTGADGEWNPNRTFPALAFLNSHSTSAMYLLSSSSTCSSWGNSGEAIVLEAMYRRHSNSVKVL